MRSDAIKRAFDQQAFGYDRLWERMAPIRDGLNFLTESVFADLPDEARILCVGVGTGAEMAYLAAKFPRWSFSAVEPSGAMLDYCRRRAEKERFPSRCHFHEGYLDSLPVQALYDAATCILVSHFILERDDRARFFRAIASRLESGGILASADLASVADSDRYEALLRFWQKIMVAGNATPEGLDQMRAAYAEDVAVLPPTVVASIIESGGFEAPVQFFQAGLIHAWFSRRQASLAV